MTEVSPFYIIVGLGNPGRAYEKTRHNIGFRVLEALAEKHGWSFRSVDAFHGLLAEGSLGNKKILLLKPQTYMNSSGEALQACLSYYKVPLTQVIVASDEIYLSFGRLRIKTSGSCGGHNGLKSIESHLGTQVYTRLKIGVGNKDGGDLADYVLAPFQDEEKQKLPGLVEEAVNALEIWLSQGVVAAMQRANSCREEEEPEKKLGE